MSIAAIDSPRALVLARPSEGAKPALSLRTVAPKQPGAGEVVVRLRAAALNRRDAWIRAGKYAGIKLPAVLGSDGAGVVSAVGAGVNGHAVGDGVIINPSLGWGGSEVAFGDGYRILGMPDDGTFADEVCVPAGNLVAKPAHMSWTEAAALPLAGLTAYRALCVRGRLRAGETVLLPGIGSGVQTMALIIARHFGARIIVTSSSAEKRERALSLGAQLAVNHRDADWGEQITKWCGGPQVHLVVDGAGGETWTKCLGLVRAGGRIVSYGATAGAPTMDLWKLFWRQIDVLGSTMGSERDFAEMVALFSAGGLHPVIDQVMPLSSGTEALDRMERGDHMGKIVLSISDG